MNTRSVDVSDCTEFGQLFESRPPTLIRTTAVALISLSTFAVGWCAMTKADLVVRANGRIRSAVQATQVFAPADTTLIGRVTHVSVDEGTHVHAGDELVQMDGMLLKNEIAKVTETIAAAEHEVASLVELETLVHQEHQSAIRKLAAEKRSEQQRLTSAKQHQESRIVQVNAALKGATEQLSRIRKLAASNAVSEAELSIAETRLLNSSEELRQARFPIDESCLGVFDQEAQLLKRSYEVRKAQLAANRAAKNGVIEAAKKEVANLQIRMQQTIVRSPIEGVIVTKAVEQGAVVRPGQALFEIAPSDGLRFDLEVPSREIGDIAVEMPVRIKLDAYDYQQYGTLFGRVCFVAPDSDVTDVSSASSHPATYTVRIVLLSDRLVSKSSEAVNLKLGLRGTAEIITDRQSVLSMMFRSVRRSISFG